MRDYLLSLRIKSLQRYEWSTISLLMLFFVPFFHPGTIFVVEIWIWMNCILDRKYSNWHYIQQVRATETLCSDGLRTPYM